MVVPGIVDDASVGIILLEEDRRDGEVHARSCFGLVDLQFSNFEGGRADSEDIAGVEGLRQQVGDGLVARSHAEPGLLGTAGKPVDLRDDVGTPLVGVVERIGPLLRGLRQPLVDRASQLEIMVVIGIGSFCAR